MDTPMALWARLICAAVLAAAIPACDEREAPAAGARVDASGSAGDAASPYSLAPRALLFGDPQRAYGRLSPDGTTLAWLEPADGVLNIWTAPVDAPQDAKVVTTARNVGVYEYEWLKNNTHIAYSLGRGGAEPRRVYSVDVITGEVMDLAPGGPDTLSSLAATSWDYPDEVIVAANDRDPDYLDLFRVNVVTGERVRIFENDRATVIRDGRRREEKLAFSRLYLDRSLNLTSASRDLPDGSRELFFKGPNGWTYIGAISPEDAPSTQVIGYDGTNSAMYTIDSRGRDAAALVRVNLQTLESTELAAVPGVDISAALLHPTTFEADAVLVDGLTVEWLPLTARAQNAFRALSKKLRDPYTVLSRTIDDRLWVVLERGPTNPGVYHLFNRETEEITRLIDVRPNLAARRLAPMTPVIIKARDGLELVSYLTLPAGADADGDGQPETASPLVVIPDMGPQRRAFLGYDPTHQWLADRGYAALSVNVRGAEGFGKAFRAAGDGEVGGAVQNDLRDAVAWAVERGVADAERTAVFGFWLNGHAALVEAAARDTPFRCAAAYNAPVDLVSLVERAPPYLAEYTTFIRLRLGDPSDPVVRARLIETSPIRFASSIRLPTLMGHGALAGGAQYDLARETAQRAHDAGAPATFVGLTQDGGNLALSPLDRRAFYAALEAFFAHCLGGRLEPIKEDIRSGHLEAPVGAEHVPELADALAE